MHLATHVAWGSAWFQQQKQQYQTSSHNYSLRKALQRIPVAHIVTVDISFHEGRKWEGGKGHSISCA